jgi:hypothetical protein
MEIGSHISKHTLYKYKSTFINAIQGLMYVYELNKFDFFFLFFNVTLFVKRPFGTKGLISELDVWFPKQSILETIEIFYPQYWLQLDVKFTFS